jgi:hypothetical protein
MSTEKYRNKKHTYTHTHIHKEQQAEKKRELHHHNKQHGQEDIKDDNKLSLTI